jgi:uroporphyrinogen decarboxylase
MESWQKFKEERLNPDLPGRFPHDWKKICDDLKNIDGLVQIGSYPYGVFGTPRELIGLENLMFAFYDDPELVHAMMDDLTAFWIRLYEKAAEDIRIDAIHIWEDMSGKQGSLISPALMRKFMVPNYKRIKKFADDHNIPIIALDTDGNVSDMISVFMEGGINLLLPFEYTDGNDVVKFRKEFPNLAILGGISKVEVSRGKEAIDAELMRVEPLFTYPGYFPALDHLIHPGISWDDFCYFCDRLRDMVMKHSQP